jgi:hypothetical protein
MFVAGTTAGAVYMPTNWSVGEGTIEPTVELPPATPFTIQVTTVVVTTVLFDRVGVAVTFAVVLIETVIDVGASANEVTMALLLLPPPPHAPSPTSAATAVAMSKIE